MDECCDDESIFLAIFIFRFLLGFAADMIVFGLGIFKNKMRKIAASQTNVSLDTGKYCHCISHHGCGGFHHWLSEVHLVLFYLNPHDYAHRA